MNVLSFLREKVYSYVTGKEESGAKASQSLRSTESTSYVQVLTILFTFVSSFLISRILGASSYGTYVYFFSWVGLFSVLANIGLNQLAVRQVSVALSNSELKTLKAFIRWSALRVLLFSVLAGAVFYFLAPLLQIESQYLRILGFFAIAILGINTLFQGYLAGAHEVVQSQIPINLFRPAAVISLLLLTLYFQDYVDVYHNILYGTIGIVLSFFYYFYLAIKKFRSLDLSPSGASMAKVWNASSYYFFLLSLVSVLNTRADLMLLGLLDTEANVGIYNIANRLTDFIPFTLVIVNMVAGPLIAKYYDQKDKERLNSFLPKIARLNFFFSTLILIFLISYGAFVLGIFGEGFRAAYPVILILGTAQWFNVSMGSVGLLLNMSGHEKQALVIQGISAGINICLDLILIPRYGILGAATATAVALVCWNLGMVWYTRKKIGIKVTLFGKI